MELRLLDLLRATAGPDRFADAPHPPSGPGVSGHEVLPRGDDPRRVGPQLRHVGEIHPVGISAERLAQPLQPGCRHGHHDRLAAGEAVAHEVGGAAHELVDAAVDQGLVAVAAGGGTARAHRHPPDRFDSRVAGPTTRSPSDQQQPTVLPPPGARAADATKAPASTGRRSGRPAPGSRSPRGHRRRRHRAASAVVAVGVLHHSPAAPSPRMSHPAPRRCSDGVDVIGREVHAPVVALPVPLTAVRRGAGRVERRDGTHVGAARGHGAVRGDLEQVFRATYPRVVAVAARVLGS